MNIAKQPIADEDLDDARRPIVTYSQRRQRGYFTGWHHHRRAQVLYASSGTMSVVTEAGAWAVAPEQAVWIPPQVEHDVTSPSALSMRSLYLDASVTRALPKHCEVWAISALLRELIIALSDMSVTEQISPAGRRMSLVVLDQLYRMEPEPFHLPLPTDRRAREIADQLLRNPADTRDLAELAQSVGASVRTMARVFQSQTAWSFGRWRQQLRVLAAVSKLAEGRSVTQVAYELGYQSPSAFVAMFKKILGEPPARYFHNLHDR